MIERPNPRSPEVVYLRPDTDLANATVQQRAAAVHTFYEFLVEDRLAICLGRGGAPSP